MPDIAIKNGVLTVVSTYKPGDPAPTGYLDWHEWAEVQHRAGLRSVACGSCGRFKYPQEISADVLHSNGKDRLGHNRAIKSRVCKKCAA